MLQIIRVIILSVWCVTCVQSINYLTRTQWNQLKYILQHPQSTDHMVHTCREIIYQHYKYYADSLAYEFKTTNYRKCRHIPLNELKLYASRGLLDAIEKYNPSFPFSKYASIYIKGQLYYGMSELHPLTLLPISKRINKQWRTKHLVLYKKMTHSKFTSNYEYYDHLYTSINEYESNHDKYNELLELWDIVNDMDEESQKIVRYKYNLYFEKIRSDKEIGDLLGCSGESIRKKIHKIKNILYTECKNKN